MCRYSVPSVPPHLGSSKAHAPLPLPFGLNRPPIANFRAFQLSTPPQKISPKISAGVNQSEGNLSVVCH
jgi:hypothetical protein